MLSEELFLASMWHTEDGKSCYEIAKLLHRKTATIVNHVRAKKRAKQQGRPFALSPAQVRAAEAMLKKMVAHARGRWEVTAEKLRKRMKLKCTDRTLLRAMHRSGVKWHRFRTKPMLKDEDVKARHSFGKKYACKSTRWWCTYVRMHIDVKKFKVFLNGKARDYAAREGSRGVYRRRGESLMAPYVKEDKTLKYNTGARGVSVLAGVGGGKVMVWEYIDGRNWSGKVAAEMYKGPIRRALKKAHPRARSWRVLEDNDPTGFKSNKGKAAKEEAGIEVFHIPKRSPQLNVCDYALWREINERMRQQERHWPRAKKETRAGYLKRLRRTALRLPRAFIDKSISNMRARCKRLLAARGRHFEEGGA